MELRPYQREAVEAAEAYFKNGGTGGALISMATGSGKSVCIAELARRTCELGGRVLVLASRKELISQNYNEFLSLWPEASVGIYSAGMKQRDRHQQVIFGLILSLYTKAEAIGPFDLLMLDEAHEVSPTGDGMYRTLIYALQQQNPAMRVIGLSATCYRTTTGMLTDDGGVFKEIVFEANLRDLINQEYLAPLKSKSSETQADLSKVHIRCGEFIQAEMEAAFDWNITRAAIKEIERLGAARKSWIVFCSSVKHSETVAKELRDRGHTAECVSGETPTLFRDQHIRDFRSGRLKCIVNCDILTTGFNAPNVDLIAILKATASPGRLVQIIGRGSRKSEGKQDCLVLDFGQNLLRHGPLDCIKPRGRKSTQRIDRSEQLAKICPNCRETVGLAARECPDCGYLFPERPIEHEATASDAPILAAPQTFRVTGLDYRRHSKAGKPASLRLDYFIDHGNIPVVSTWVCLEHQGFAQFKAHQFWAGASKEKRPPPATVEEALERKSELKVPKTITAIKEGKFWRVLKVEYKTAEEEALPAEKDEFEKLFEETGLNI